MLSIILNHLVEIFLSIIVFFVSYLYKKIIGFSRMINSTCEGVKILLKNRIIEKYYTFKKDGFISIFDKQIVNELYNEYHNLGGNGVISDIINEINELDIKE